MPSLHGLEGDGIEVHTSQEASLVPFTQALQESL